MGLRDISGSSLSTTKSRKWAHGLIFFKFSFSWAYFTRYGGAYSKRRWGKGDYGIMVKVRTYQYITVICFCCVLVLIYLFLVKKRCSSEWHFCWAYIRYSKRFIFWVFLAFYGTSTILRSFYFETLIVNLVQKLSL